MELCSSSGSEASYRMDQVTSRRSSASGQAHKDQLGFCKASLAHSVDTRDAEAEARKQAYYTPGSGFDYGALSWYGDEQHCVETHYFQY